MTSAVRLFVDFDGTVSRADTTDLVLQHFADAAWLEVEAAWERGEIGSRECMVRQLDLVRVTPERLDELLAGVELDPYFPAFVGLCGSLGVPVSIVSDGLDRSVQAALRRYGLSMPALANRLEWRGGACWRLSFPLARHDCRSLAGHCKCRSMGDKGLRVLVGDGRSDFCAARSADMVFAKAKLLTHCREEGIAHAAFSDFAELSRLFIDWLAARGLALPKTLPSKDVIHAE
jgi:2-hydroxy-3-keto-5-methylthiopentenyl-1-phosphate phosphatase